jgi:hypothetical protein
MHVNIISDIKLPLIHTQIRTKFYILINQKICDDKMWLPMY